MFEWMVELERAVHAAAGCDADEDGQDLLTVELDTLNATIRGLQQQERRLRALRLRLVARADRAVAWQRDGARSAKEWLQEQLGQTAGEAARDVETARRLEGLPRTAEKFNDGQVSPEQAAAAARAARNVTDAHTRAELDGLVADTAPGCNRAQLQEQIDRFEAEHAPDEQAEKEQLAFERRNLSLSKRRDGIGWRINGDLDVLGGEAVATALDALSAPHSADDPRSGEQRRADALSTLARQALDADRLPDVARARPHITLVVPADWLAGHGGTPGELDHYGPVSSATAQTVFCDAAITVVVRDANGKPLDLGLYQRSASIYQRRGLATIYAGCAGCGAPASWCDAHHVKWWSDGGRTDLDNLVLLCWTCHTDVHRGRATLQRTRDGTWTYVRTAGVGHRPAQPDSPPGRTAATAHPHGDPPPNSRRPADGRPPGRVDQPPNRGPTRHAQMPF